MYNKHTISTTTAMTALQYAHDDISKDYDICSLMYRMVCKMFAMSDIWSAGS